MNEEGDERHYSFKRRILGEEDSMAIVVD